MMRLLRLFGENHRLNLLNRPTTGRFHALSRGLQENRTVASGALPSSDREAGYGVRHIPDYLAKFLGRS
jgi:hypothetical protein